MKDERMRELLKLAVNHIESFKEDESVNVFKSLGFTEDEIAEIKIETGLNDADKRNMHEILELHAKRLLEFDNADDYIRYWNCNIVNEVNKLNDEGIISDDEIKEFVKNFGINGDEFDELLKLRIKRPLWFKTVHTTGNIMSNEFVDISKQKSLDTKIDTADKKTEKQINVKPDRHVIWSNMNLNFDDWADDLRAEYPYESEDGLYELMHEINGAYLDDERQNLDIQMNQPILVIADLGLWNGRRDGYKEIMSGNIKDCLYSNTDITEWYVDKHGDLRADAIHHDGTNHYLYRVYKDNVSDTKKENLKNKIYESTATRSDITRITKRLGDEIAKVYGWEIAKQRQAKESVR